MMIRFVTPCLAALMISLPTALPPSMAPLAPGLRMLGSGTLNWFGLHVYTAALYVEGEGYSSGETAVLHITYHRNIKSRRLLETTVEEWQRMNKGSAEQRREWAAVLTGLWPDVKPGDSLVAVQARKGETLFYSGEKRLGAVSDPDFGPAFFAIWLDPACRYPSLRDALLGGKP